jgi:N,N'-diacetyllegionaminate synthase
MKSARNIKLIAETAWHHQGEFDFMKQLVGAICQQTQADIVKLHLTLDFDEYMMPSHPLYDELRGRVLDQAQWKEIIEIILGSEQELMLLFNDRQAIEFGMSFKPTLVEIHSACLNDIHLLKALKEHLDPHTRVVLGVGGSSLDEIESAVNILDSSRIVLMFGFQNFPTKYENINFARMRRIMQLFPDFAYGYADHTAWDEPTNVLITLMGAAVGMEYVEKHVTTAYGKQRLDGSAAISLAMLNELKQKLDILAACNGDGLLRLNQGEREYSVFGPMKKAAIVHRDVAKGARLSEDMLLFRRIAQTTDLSQVEVLQRLGSIITQDLKQGDVLTRSSLETPKGERLK